MDSDAWATGPARPSHFNPRDTWRERRHTIMLWGEREWRPRLRKLLREICVDFISIHSDLVTCTESDTTSFSWCVMSTRMQFVQHNRERNIEGAQMLSVEQNLVAHNRVGRSEFTVSWCVIDAACNNCHTVSTRHFQVYACSHIWFPLIALILDEFILRAGFQLYQTCESKREWVFTYLMFIHRISSIFETLLASFHWIFSIRHGWCHRGFFLISQSILDDFYRVRRWCIQFCRFHIIRTHGQME